MIQSSGYAALSEGAALVPFCFNRRDLGPNDIVLEILYCGICHSDLCFVDNEWGFSKYPLVPGHEIVGRVSAVGDAVTKFKIGDMAAIGCLIDSCRECQRCETGAENLCEQHPTSTYGGLERSTGQPTYGGYSDNYVVDEHFALQIPAGLDPARAAPLLCAGITTYSPMKQWKVGPGQRIGIVGIGGLGHLAVKIGRAMGAEVVMFTTSPKKIPDALTLGATAVIVSTDMAQMAGQVASFDFILDTVSAVHDVNAYISLLKNEGVLCVLGIPGEGLSLSAMSLIVGRKILAGSNIGGLAETQEMLDFCGHHKITADIELLSLENVNLAYERLRRNDVKYRFVIDMNKPRS